MSSDADETNIYNTFVQVGHAGFPGFEVLVESGILSRSSLPALISAKFATSGQCKLLDERAHVFLDSWSGRFRMNVFACCQNL